MTSLTTPLARLLRGAQPEEMTQHSQHPEVHVGHELSVALERVAGGTERVIVLTDDGGEPLAALVSLSMLRQLDELDTTADAANADEIDRSNVRLR